MALIVLSFATIHDAIAAEKAAGAAIAAAREGGGAAAVAKAELLPLPPAIESDCGFGLFMDTGSGAEQGLLAALRSAFRFEGAYTLREAGETASGRKETSYERIDQAD